MKLKKPKEKALAFIAAKKQFDGAESLWFPVEKAAELFPTVQIELSISHCKEYATATALVTDKK